MNVYQLNDITMVVLFWILKQLKHLRGFETMNECLTTLNRTKVSTLIDGGSVGALNVRTKVSTLIDGGSVGAVNVRTKVSTLIDGGSVGAVNVRPKVSTLIDGFLSLSPHGLLFLISSKGSFICIIPETG